MPKPILITGALGSIGVPLTNALRNQGRAVVPTDVTLPFDDANYGNLDVTDATRVGSWLRQIAPPVIYHLAADKHAPNGEEDPANTASVNLDGTRNILEAANGAKVILASTCKAANPETAYGASKLIAERMVLNAGGTVVRLYNVPETQGNVFRLWESIPEDEPIPYTDCHRFFVSLERAVDLFVKALDLPPGRYAPDPFVLRLMKSVAREHYPNRELVEVPRRRGDRKAEPLCGTCETVDRSIPGILKIISTHDADYAQAA